MSRRAVVFDLDGTLLDTLADIARAANSVLVRRGFPPHPVEAYRFFVGRGMGVLMERALPAAARDADTIRACTAQVEREYARCWAETTRPYPGVEEMLGALDEDGIPAAVLSNKPDAFTRLCVEKFFPGRPFEAVRGAGSGLPPKPDPAGALALAERMGVAPGECVFVGDSGVDMETARRAGMYGVGVLWGFRGGKELEEHGARTCIREPAGLVRLLRDGWDAAGHG